MMLDMKCGATLQNDRLKANRWQDFLASLLVQFIFFLTKTTNITETVSVIGATSNAIDYRNMRWVLFGF